MRRLGLLVFAPLVSLIALASSAVAQPFTAITTGDIVNDLSYSEGALWADVDGDDDLDLFVGNIISQNNLFYLNDGAGNFTSVLAGDVVSDGGFSYGGVFVDLDNDGDPDLFVENGGASQPNAVNFLYRNDGGVFAKQLAGSVVTDLNGSWSTSAADYDLDGDLDIFVANYNQNNALYRNDGGLGFTAITTGAVVTDGGGSTGSSWADWDDDGDPDLFVANSNFGAGAVNFLYRNDGGTLVRYNDGQGIMTHAKNSIGASWGDTDNDGDLDLLVANYSGANNHYYRNEGGGTFTRITPSVGLNHGGDSVCGAFGDWNNDGHLDLFVANDNNQNNLLYENDGDGTFTLHVTGSPVSDGGRSNGSAWADIDADGDLDLFVTNGDQPVAQSNFLYRNDGGGGSNHWLHVRCVGVASNRSAIGARVRVKATIGGSPFWQVREISSQTGYNAQNSLVVEFGLGDATIVDSLVVDWPLGQQDVYTAVPADEVLRLVEGGSPTGVAVSQRPHDLSIELAQNRPNPFRGGTRIAWSIPAAGPVQLEMFDVAGRRLRTLENAEFAEGTHTTHVSADGLAPGIYFYVLRANGEATTRRFELLR